MNEFQNFLVEGGFVLSAPTGIPLSGLRLPESKNTLVPQCKTNHYLFR
jgi:hypothetical protein